MSLILAKCIEFNDKRKICVAEENSKRYQLNNISGVTVKKVRIDNCLPQNAGEKRCDFLMEVVEAQRVYFIELKGGDLTRAAKQIYSTILYLKTDFKQHRIDARIVGSRDVPGYKNTMDYRKLASQVLPTKGTIERATNNIYIETI